MIELYDGFVVIRILPLRISDKVKADGLGLFSMEHVI